MTEKLTLDQLWSKLKCLGPKNSKDNVQDQNYKMSICSGPVLAFTLRLIYEIIPLPKGKRE